MNPSAKSRSSWKIPKITEEITALNRNNFNVPFIALVETWLTPVITEPEIKIANYNIFRSDRKSSQHGGILLYVHKSVVIDISSNFDNDVCGGVICLSSHSKCIIGCIYRPPTCELSKFKDLLLFLQHFLDKNNPNDKYNVCIFGDFNLPKFCWKFVDDTNSTSSAPSYTSLSNFMIKNFLSQYIL